MQSTTIIVSLDEFDMEDIAEYARDHLDMVEINDLSLETFYDHEELVKFLRSKGYTVNENFYYPHNSITTKAAYDRLLNNVGKIPIQEIENLLDKYNCI